MAWMKAVKTALAFIVVGAAVSSFGMGQEKPGTSTSTVDWKKLIPAMGTARYATAGAAEKQRRLPPDVGIADDIGTVPPPVVNG
jgi:hypothetical protein